MSTVFLEHFAGLARHYEQTMTKQFRELVDRHRDRVYTFAYYSLGNREEAEDATQEVLLRLWKHWRELDDKTAAAWITRVARNVCIDVIRRRRTYRTRFVANSDGDDFVTAISAEPSPEERLHTSELQFHIKRALIEVREPYRSVVILREVQDMKYEEICDALDLPLNTVKSYLHRARRMLRDQLRDTIEHDSI